jgi:hypothetical protein
MWSWFLKVMRSNKIMPNKVVMFAAKNGARTSTMLALHASLINSVMQSLKRNIDGNF